MQKELEKPHKNIVVIGGGTGMHTLLRGLRRYTDFVSLRAVVTMADSGGSTGRLRDEFGYLPIGDVRLALHALAREVDEHDDILRKLFSYRFDRGAGLSGHTFGNLFLIALTDLMGSEEAAIQAASIVLATCGEVIPVTTELAHLTAKYTDGTIRTGEHEIDVAKDISDNLHIEKLYLTPHVRGTERALEAILAADLVVLGPGDFYTSVLTNCVVGGVADAIKNSRGKIVYVANLMSRRGQSEGMGTHEYLHELKQYLGRMPEYLLVNTTPLRTDLRMHYEGEHEYPVVHNYTEKECRVIAGDFLAVDDVKQVKGDVLKRSLIRHDSHKLAHAMMQII